MSRVKSGKIFGAKDEDDGGYEFDRIEAACADEILIFSDRPRDCRA